MNNVTTCGVQKRKKERQAIPENADNPEEERTKKGRKRQKNEEKFARACIYKKKIVILRDISGPDSIRRRIAMRGAVSDRGR